METMLDRRHAITDGGVEAKGRKLTLLVMAAIGLISAASAAVAAPLPAEGAFTRTPAPALFVMAFDGSRPKRKPQFPSSFREIAFAEHGGGMPAVRPDPSGGVRPLFILPTRSKIIAEQ